MICGKNDISAERCHRILLGNADIGKGDRMYGQEKEKV